MIFSADGRRLLTASNGRIRHWDARLGAGETPEQIRTRLEVATGMNAETLAPLSQAEWRLRRAERAGVALPEVPAL